ncbi:unnamed protein product [Mytilus edulis]|uniref:Uncharacterized protein n=1 Tax=Mytilus edulis TaxID=6550 RepID=A0A8S3TZ04_MYTED|nr:unnamed protein product [Mytilus edulis]
MCNSTNTEDKIKYKGSLCREHILQSNVAKLENALQYMHEEGLFSREVYAILNQWQTTESVDEQAERVLKNANGRTDARPHITIKITRNSQDTDLMNVNYIIPINNAYLHIHTTHNQENKDDSFIPPEIFQFLSDNESDNQTEFSSKDKLFSVKDKNNDHETSCLECQGAVLSATNAYQETQTIVGTPTKSDFVRFCNINDNIVDNLGNGDSGASTSKNCADSIDNSASNDQEICSNDVLDSLILNFRLIDQMHDMRDNCEGQTWEDSESDQETCYLESTESPNPQDSLEDNDDVKNNQNKLTDDKVLENCLDLVNYISGKPSEIETFYHNNPPYYKSYKFIEKSFKHLHCLTMITVEICILFCV